MRTIVQLERNAVKLCQGNTCIEAQGKYADLLSDIAALSMVLVALAYMVKLLK